MFIRIFAALLLVPFGTYAKPPGWNWRIEFQDQFNGQGIDTNKWRVVHDRDWPWWTGTDNGKKPNVSCCNSNYTRANAFIAGDGTNRFLKLLNKYDGFSQQKRQYSGGRIQSKRTFSKGRYFEARIRIGPQGHDMKHFWPTFWLFKQGVGEFDIIERSGHFIRASGAQHAQKQGLKQYNAASPVDIQPLKWNTWGLLWTDTRVDFYFNDDHWFSVPAAHVQAARLNELEMIFSTSPNFNSIPSPAQASKYPSFEVDWVNVWIGGNPGPRTTAPANGATIAMLAHGGSRLVTVDAANNVVTKPVSTTITNSEKFMVERIPGGPYIALKS